MALSAFGQDDYQSGMIKMADGVLVVWNEPGNCYTIEIKGKSIELIPDKPLWFKMGGKFFQILTAGKNRILNQPAAATDDRSLLTAHRQWESDYIAEAIQRKIDVQSSWTKLTTGTEALQWSYDMPEIDRRQTALRPLCLTVVKRDRILALNTVVEPADDEQKLWQLLTGTMNTLKPSDKPISLKAASEQVKNS